MKKRNWFWGIFFILAGVFVIATQTGSFAHIDFFSVAATVLLAAVFIASIPDRNFFGMILPLSLLYIIYQVPLHFPLVGPWLVILAGILLSTGLSIIFGSHHHHHWDCKGHGAEYARHISETSDDNNPSASVSFGSTATYLHGDCVTGGQFSCSFGSLEIFFDQARLSPEGATAVLDCSFGAIKIYVPKGWKVIDSIHASLGGVNNDERFSQPATDAPRLTLTGGVQFGAVEIHYV